MSEWVEFTCGLCRTRLRIREQYAHLKGRCPDCGFRIQPLRPPPPATVPRSASTLSGGEAGAIPDDIGLMPEEEEWPEPALHAESEAFEGIYSVAGWAPAPATDAGSSSSALPPAQQASSTVPVSTPVNFSTPSGASSAQMPEADPGVEAAVPADAGEDRDEVFRLVEDDAVRPAPGMPAVSAGTQSPQSPVTSAPPSPVKTERVIDPLFLDEIEPPPTSKSLPTDPLATVPTKSSSARTTPGATAAEPIVTPYNLSGPSGGIPTPPPPPLATFAEPPSSEVLAQSEGDTGSTRSKRKRKRPAGTDGRPDTGERTGAQSGPGIEPPGTPSEIPTHDEEFVQAEIKRLTQPPPPDQVFFAPAIWNYPWRREGIGAWLTTAIGLSLTLGLGVVLQWVPDSPLRSLLTSLIGLAALLVAGLTGLVLAPRYFQIVAATANEANEAEGPALELSDRLASLVRLVWLLLLSAVPSLPLLLLGWNWLPVALLIVLAAWPVVVLSSLEDGSFFWPVRARVLSALKTRSNFYISGWFLSVLLWLPLCLLLLFGLTWQSAPVLALGIAAAWLIYARLVGRLGWVLNWDEAKVMEQRQRRRSAASRRRTEDTPAKPPSGDPTSTKNRTVPEPLSKSDLLQDRFV